MAGGSYFHLCQNIMNHLDHIFINNLKYFESIISYVFLLGREGGDIVKFKGFLIGWWPCKFFCILNIWIPSSVQNTYGIY